MATINGTFNSLIAGTLSGTVATPGAQGLPGPQGPVGPAGAPGVGVPAGGLTGQFLTKSSNLDYATAWTTISLSDYLTKSGNLAGLTDLFTARDNLNLGTLNSPTFAGITLQGSGANVGQYTPTSVTLTHATFGQFTIQPSSGITFPDTTVQTTAFNASVLLPYAPLLSPVFIGNPTAPTPAFGDNDTTIATTAFVQAGLLGGTANARNLEVEVRNQSGSTIPAGSIVYISGATGNLPLVTLAQANNDANSAQTMGFTKTAIANNGTGYVIVRGVIENINTSALTEGVQLYLSPTTAGTWTTTKPVAPQHLVYVGIVIRSHPTLGTILVAVQNGYELDELHDVLIASPLNNQVLTYESATGLWKNKAAAGGAVWGGITGTLSSQTDLVNALAAKYDASNPSGFQTASQVTTALAPYLLSATAASTYQTLAGMSSYLTTSAAASTYFTITAAAGKANLSGATFTGKVNFTPVAGASGLNVGIGGTSAASTTNGDLWITTGGTNLNFRDGTGSWRILVNTSNTNTFSAPQIIDTTSTTTALRVTQKGTGDAIRVEDDTTPDATRFVVDQFGKVGVGVAPDTTAALKVDTNGIMFGDGTVQTTASPPFEYVSGTASLVYGTNRLQLNPFNLQIGDTSTGLTLTTLNAAGITFPDGSTQSTAATSGISDAPTDGNYYVRQSGAWVQCTVVSIYNSNDDTSYNCLTV